MIKRRNLWPEIIITYAAAILLFWLGNMIIRAVDGMAARMAVQVIIYIGAISVPFTICVSKRMKMSFLGYTKANVGGQVAAALCIATILLFFVISLPMMAGVSKYAILGSKPSSPGIFAFYVIFNFVFAGLGEEFIFRGFLLKSLQTTTGSDAAAIIISSLMFGFVHFPGVFSVSNLLITTGIGLFFGLLRCKIKNCTPLALGIAHGLYGAIVIILSYILL